MINLIRNELYKIFHKKGTFIILIIMFAFVILTNFIYKQMNNVRITEYTDSNYEEALSYTKENTLSEDNLDEYLFYEVIIDTYDYYKKYSEPWQKNVISNYLSEDYYEYHLNEFYGNTEDMQNIKNDIDKINENLENGNWQYFVNKDIAKLKIDLVAAQKLPKEVDAKKETDIINKKIELLEYRLKENIPIGSDSYLNNAIMDVDVTTRDVIEYKYSNRSAYDYGYALKSYYIGEYILENKVDVNNTESSRYMFIDFYSEYYFLILVFVIMIAGSIVSDEFNKGTIKSMLILPYSRIKIITAKLITSIIMLLFGILAMFVMQFIIGGLFFGFSSLAIPFVTYNLATEKIVEMNVIKYWLILTGTIIPKLLLLETLAFALSAVFINTAVAITVTFCGYIGEQIVNALAAAYNVKFLNYFVTTNWNFNDLLFGGQPRFDISLTQNIIVCLAYFIFMVVVAFIVFKKRDIKNI